MGALKNATSNNSKQKGGKAEAFGSLIYSLERNPGSDIKPTIWRL